MGKHQIGPGDLCDSNEPPRSGRVRLLHRARFVEDAWLCRSVGTRLISVIPASRLNYIREAAPVPRVRTAVYGRAAR